MTSSFKRSNPENCNTLEDLTTFIMKLSDAEIIVAGDFNARTGSNNFESNETLNNWNNNRLKSKISYTASPYRVSQDKTTNGRGKNSLTCLHPPILRY